LRQQTGFAALQNTVKQLQQLLPHQQRQHQPQQQQQQ
jgi:hypothetical protein